MATGFSQYFLQTYVFPQFRGQGATAPDSLLVELTSTIPDATGTATALTGGTAPGYAPLEIDCVPGEWEFLGARTLANKNLKLFPAAITSSWPSIQGWQIKDVASNVLVFGHIGSGRIIDPTQRFKLMPQALKIRIPDAQQYVSDVFCQLILGVFQGTNIPALGSFQVDFGTLDPTTTGVIGKLSGSGYTPLVIAANTTEMEAPSLRTVANKVEFDHTRMWTTTSDIESIKSAELSVAGTPWLRGLLTNQISLKANDNARIPVGAIAIRG